MRPPLTFEIVMLLSKSELGLQSAMIARELEASRHAVQKALPKLVARGFVTRAKARKGEFSRYFVTDEQAARYRLSCVRRAPAQFGAMRDDAIARKLKFLESVGRGVFGESPVLAEIIADFQELRRRQAETESR